MNKQLSAVALSMLAGVLLSACGDEKAESTEAAKAAPDAKTAPAAQADDGWKNFDVPGTAFIVRIPRWRSDGMQGRGCRWRLKAVHCGAESEQHRQHGVS